MHFLKSKRLFLQFSLILALVLSSPFLSACSEGSGEAMKAGAEGPVNPQANSEESTQGKQWNKMSWDAGKWG